MERSFSLTRDSLKGLYPTMPYSAHPRRGHPSFRFSPRQSEDGAIGPLFFVSLHDTALPTFVILSLMFFRARAPPPLVDMTLRVRCIRLCQRIFSSVSPYVGFVLNSYIAGMVSPPPPSSLETRCGMTGEIVQISLPLSFLSRLTLPIVKVWAPIFPKGPRFLHLRNVLPSRPFFFSFPLIYFIPRLETHMFSPGLSPFCSVTFFSYG